MLTRSAGARNTSGIVMMVLENKSISPRWSQVATQALGSMAVLPK